MSESVKLRCSRIPVDIAAPVRMNGSDTSITIAYAENNDWLEPQLYNATLLGFKISYAAAEYAAGGGPPWNTWQQWHSIIVGPENRWYTLTDLLPGWLYRIQVQTITETGLNDL